MIKLYREHDINPLGGCLPLLIQLPIIWAFLRALQSITLCQKQLLFWFGISTLSAKDAAAMGAVQGLIYLLLPALAVLTTYLQTKQTATDPSQKMLVMDASNDWSFQL